MNSANVKGSFKDILGLLNTTLGGRLFSRTDGTHEIYIENDIHRTFLSILIKREKSAEGRTTVLSFQQGVLKNKVIKFTGTYRDLEKVYVSITTGLSVAMLFVQGERFTVFDISKNAGISVVSGKERRNKNYEESYSDNNYYSDAEKKKQKDRRKIFITL